MFTKTCILIYDSFLGFPSRPQNKHKFKLLLYHFLTYFQIFNLKILISSLSTTWCGSRVFLNPPFQDSRNKPTLELTPKLNMDRYFLNNRCVVKSKNDHWLVKFYPCRLPLLYLCTVYEYDCRGSGFKLALPSNHSRLT